MKPISSAITTLQKGQPSKTGTQLGERGSAMPEDSQKIAQWLVQHKPEDLDKAALSRASSLNVGLMVKYDWRFPSGPNGEKMKSYKVAVGCDVNGSQIDKERVLSDLSKFCTPAPVRAIEGWLAELSVISVSRNREGFETNLLISAYSSRLREYPADVVRYALIVKPWKWWPTWDELKKVCDAKAGPRRAMIAAIGAPPPKPEREYRTPTQEERDRVQAMVDEKFPEISLDFRKNAVDTALSGVCMADKPRAE